MVFNATFNNISVTSWRSVLLVEKTTDLSQVTDKLYHMIIHFLVLNTNNPNPYNTVLINTLVWLYIYTTCISICSHFAFQFLHRLYRTRQCLSKNRNQNFRVGTKIRVSSVNRTFVGHIITQQYYHYILTNRFIGGRKLAQIPCISIYSHFEGDVVVLIVWKLDLQLPMQSVPITINVVSKNPTQAIKYHVIKFVSDLRQVCGFLRLCNPVQIEQ
jgi:hypothetical protein